MSSQPSEFPRTLPALDLDNEAFWTGGKNGELLINRCDDCGYYVHPPTGFCPSCESRDVRPQPVSGRGEIVTMTVNYRAWFPDIPVPYVVAMVAIEEQQDVRLITNIVDCDPLSVEIGDKVRVRFEQVEDLWIPLFFPDPEARP
ncbi:MAG: OB-fold domain-containing protein [Novosphingobium sp.]|nr:OB-fold domain-containing protein [Novosphingobium sp.]